MPYHHGNLRAELLERAAEVVAESGVEALSLRSLARDLGVSHNAPRKHFASRAALLTALATEGCHRALAAMEKSAEAAGRDPVDRLRARGRAYVRFAFEQPAFFRASNHPEVQRASDEELYAAFGAWCNELRKNAEAAQADGWMPDIDPDTLVAIVVAGAVGVATVLCDEGWREVLAVDDIDAVADAMFERLIQSRR